MIEDDDRDRLADFMELRPGLNPLDPGDATTETKFIPGCFGRRPWVLEQDD